MKVTSANFKLLFATRIQELEARQKVDANINEEEAVQGKVEPEPNRLHVKEIGRSF